MSNPNKAKVYCIAAGCRNNDKNSKCAFFSVPLGQSLEGRQRCEKWMTSLGRRDLFEKRDLRKRSYKVCSAHFADSSMKLVKVLKKDAVPTLFLAEQEEEQSESEDDLNDTGTQTTSFTKNSSTKKQTKEKGKTANKMLKKNKEINQEPLDKTETSTSITGNRSTIDEIREVYANEGLEVEIEIERTDISNKTKAIKQEPVDLEEFNEEGNVAANNIEITMEEIKQEPEDNQTTTPPLKKGQKKRKLN